MDIITVVYITGWWFGTFFIFHNIWDNPSHWLIFFKIVKTTNQISLLRATFGSVLSCWIFGILPGWSTGSKPVSRYYHGHLGIFRESSVFMVAPESAKFVGCWCCRFHCVQHLFHMIHQYFAIWPPTWLQWLQCHRRDFCASLPAVPFALLHRHRYIHTYLYMVPSGVIGTY